MIDIENYMFDEVVYQMATLEPSCLVAPYNGRYPDVLPCVHMVEASNYPDTRTSDSGSEENFVDLTYEFNIFAKGSNKKADCKRISNSIDTIMKNIGFKRIVRRPYEVIEDNDLHRLVVRYSGVVTIVTDNNTQTIRVYRGG